MFCKILSALFGRDTRPAQVINLTVGLFWVLALQLQSHNIIAIELPAPIILNSFVLSIGLGIAALFSVLGLANTGRPHQVFKAFGMALGALTQAILANGYVTEFPPLDMQIVVCTGLSVWYLLAVFYIFKCEGIDE